MVYTDNFILYCNDIAAKNNIEIINEEKWYKSIWQKGWNQYNLLYELCKEINCKLITSEMLINLYKANIRLRNVLYELSLFIEESFKAWLYFLKIDDSKNELNTKTIGQLLKEKKITRQIKLDFLKRENPEFNDLNIIEGIFTSWRDIRNLVCHRSLKMLLREETLFKKINNIYYLLEQKQKEKFNSRIKESLKHVIIFIENKWKEEWECFSKN